jgi:hypothetical protein
MDRHKEKSGAEAAFRQEVGMRKRWLAPVILSIFAVLQPARAVIFYNTGDPTYNTTAPTGSLAGSGWQWVGTFDGYAATPIGPHHFLAAHHIEGSVGDVITFNGASYTTIAYFDDTVSDLRIWEISGTFPTWAPLYRNSAEVGSQLVVFGMGLSRGAAVTVGGALKGWMWGSGGETLRWGTNTVNSIVDGGAYWGALLYALFQASDDPNEAHLAVGDSSGPVFINDGSGWKLAGVAATVDGYFNYTDSDDGYFDAAIFDARGLYYGDPGDWQLVGGDSPVPSGFYATQVSVRASWIDSIVPPVADCDTPVLSGLQKGLLAALILLMGCFLLRNPDPLARPS